MSEERQRGTPLVHRHVRFSLSKQPTYKYCTPHRQIQIQILTNTNVSITYKYLILTTNIQYMYTYIKTVLSSELLWQTNTNQNPRYFVLLASHTRILGRNSSNHLNKSIEKYCFPVPAQLTLMTATWPNGSSQCKVDHSPTPRRCKQDAINDLLLLCSCTWYNTQMSDTNTNSNTS